MGVIGLCVGVLWRTKSLKITFLNTRQIIFGNTIKFNLQNINECLGVQQTCKSFWLICEKIKHAKLNLNSLFKHWIP